MPTQDFDGVLVPVSRAEERAEKDDSSSSRTESDSRRTKKDEAPAASTSGSQRIFVGGLHADITAQQLRDEFSQFGEIKDVYIPKDVRTHVSRGFCYITFESKGGVEGAVENPPQEIGGHPIGEVKIAEARPSSSTGASAGSYGHDSGRGGSYSSYSGVYANDRFSAGRSDHYRDGGGYGNSRYASSYDDDYGRGDSRRDPYAHAYIPAPYPSEPRGYADLYPPLSGSDAAYGAYRHAPSKERYRPY
jgi:RNA recognition motif-containing protein